MRTTRIILETINALALGIWAGMLVFVGIAAALTFPMMKELDPTLPAYALYEGQHWRIAAGSVMNPLFSAVGTIGMVALFIAAAVFALRIVTWKRGIGWFPIVTRTVLFIGLCFVQCVTHFGLWRQMDQLFRMFSQGAQEGDVYFAEDALAKFNLLHPIATPMMSVLLFLIVAYLIVSLLTSFRIRTNDEADV